MNGSSFAPSTTEMPVKLAYPLPLVQLKSGKKKCCKKYKKGKRCKKCPNR